MVSVLADREQGALVYKRGACYPTLMEESQHFRDMLVERHIPREWVERAMLAPDKTEDHEDVFFDRRLESQK